MTKLFVGNLPYSTTDQELNDMFTKFGKVLSAKVITDKYSGRSKGFGFVEMATDEEAQKAVEMWNGKELDGRTLTVNEARPMEPRAPRSGGSGFNRGGYGGNQRGNW